MVSWVGLGKTAGRSLAMKSFSLAMARFCYLLFALPLLVFAQDRVPHFDSASKVFRLDGGPASYVFGVNTRAKLQKLCWGARLGAPNRFTPAEPMPEWVSFDSSY